MRRIFLLRAFSDFPRSVNIFVLSDTTASGVSYVGLSAGLPGSDISPQLAIVFISWDEFLRGTPETYHSGSQALLHEVLHFLGLYHTFQKPTTYNAPKCTDGDYVDDTPTVSTVRHLNGGRLTVVVLPAGAYGLPQQCGT
ncbi:hypothetical protein VOLCADRAFT_87836 [Volvox carteri f. nagariensis]|uniref:Peptidase M43 pregnancy-associated plasma-A domain-containing protein n=1 Tax=Volvox carteri f. nagariensis TaxID=3068 RepID=D8TMD5_VOLCA|nr:uncharacterized protein VOLCADRAFT_87836 [Volvox carteri f. nagariensis]EFJ51484.1 hypothetical protein VOLCADRAFT_87836 [Volvox carteri f. nagariensis]|eukprot:XP_002947436.1 hypothetical protein VOLCADRAFT_87836 [Volvox carteri f. nagariensis]